MSTIAVLAAAGCGYTNQARPQDPRATTAGEPLTLRQIEQGAQQLFDNGGRRVIGYGPLGAVTPIYGRSAGAGG